MHLLFQKQSQQAGGKKSQLSFLTSSEAFVQWSVKQIAEMILLHKIKGEQASLVSFLLLWHKNPLTKTNLGEERILFRFILIIEGGQARNSVQELGGRIAFYSR